MNTPAGQRRVPHSERQRTLGTFCFQALVVKFRARVCATDLPLEYVNEAIHELGQAKR